jgi:hypothetical protein
LNIPRLDVHQVLKATQGHGLEPHSSRRSPQEAEVGVKVRRGWRQSSFQFYIRLFIECDMTIATMFFLKKIGKNT